MTHLVVAAMAALSAGAANAAGFTAEQAAAGETAYNSNCAQCHGRQLEGPDAPGLAGVDVMANWDTAGGLYDFIHVAMPPSAPGQLGEETYLNIVAYIMKFNGAEPGDAQLTADPDLMASISLTAETAAGAASMAAAQLDAGGAPAAASTTPAVAVPQAYTWGKQLPGGPAPAEQKAAETTTSSVPQAFTWGKTLPSVNDAASK